MASNSSSRVRRATETAFRAENERERLDALTALRGISIPTASAALTLLDPERYGVIDIRVWRLLRAVRGVEGNPRGAQFTFAQWEQFLAVIRELAARHAVSARTIERTLFAIHTRYSEGPLYGTGGTLRIRGIASRP